MGRSITKGGDSSAMAEVATSSLRVAWGPLEHDGSLNDSR